MPVDGKTTVGLVSLGCAKNLIDSEIMIGHLQEAGMVMTPEPELADVLIINTCSFIDQAKMESINAIHEAVDDREVSRPRQKIIVAGCLSQRFSKELPGLMPEVDASEIKPGLGANDIPRLFRVQTFVNIVARLLEEKGVEVE